MGNHLHIYRASAGSGKTYTIAREFLKMALSPLHKGNYRNIQAVTFTNKATEEMKQRILNYLYSVSTGANETLIRELCESFTSDFCKLGITQIEEQANELQKRATACLRAMLLDYGSFRISTIDSFFQEILRSFARELNLPASFRLEVENHSTLETATMGLFADSYRLGDKDVMLWLQELSFNNIRSGKGYNPLVEIRKLSEELFREDVRSLMLTLGRSEEETNSNFPSIVQVRRLRDWLESKQEAFLRQTQALAEDIMCYVRPGIKMGIPLGTPGTHLAKVASGKLSQIIKEGKENPYPKKVHSLAEKPIAVFVQKNSKHLLKDYNFAPISLAAEAYREHMIKEFRPYITRDLILKNIYSLGLLSALELKIRELQRNNNYILLADAPSLINQILSDESGVPFLYERIGSRILHHMIDEFQDTSVIQYANFYPLLHEGLASGNDSLVVGDVKQSIYRFRGSESGLLLQLHKSKVLPSKLHTLKTNWRSSPEIIEFNNTLYAHLPQLLSDKYTSWINSYDLGHEEVEALRKEVSIFTHNYADAKQGINPHLSPNIQGAVVVHECLYERLEASEDDNEDEEDKDEDPNTTEQELHNKLSHQLPELLINLYERGFKPSDIAILVRNKQEASHIAYILQNATNKPEEGFDFISAEALKPREAIAVNCVITALHYIIQPEDKVKAEELRSFYNLLCNKDLSSKQMERLRNMGQRGLYETIEAVISEFKEEISLGEIPHLIKLLDTALSYQQDLSLDLADFLDMWANEGDRLRLAIPADENKLHLMTIHKSKGLEFPIVLLPYLNWELVATRGKAPILWCSNPYIQDTNIPILPIQMEQALLNSVFAPNYMQENIRISLDALNLLYVATTRAKQELHLWLIDKASCPSRGSTPYSYIKNGEGKDAIPQRVLPLVREILDKASLPLHYLPLDALDERLKLYQDLPRKLSKESNTETRSNHRIELNSLESYPLGNRIEELREGLAYFAEDKQRHFGSVMHQILSNMISIEDVTRIRDEVFERGDLLPEEKEEADRRLKLLLNETQAKPWFNGSGKVRNEVTILGSQAGVYRPDRIITYPDGSAVVVDYKFGREDKSYKDQVLNYADLLRKMGYSPVDAYLWYLIEEQDNGDEELHSKVYHIGRLVR